MSSPACAPGHHVSAVAESPIVGGEGGIGLASLPRLRRALRGSGSNPVGSSAPPLYAIHSRRASAAAVNGGEGGIRTHGTREGTTVFETVPIDHSGTSPQDEDDASLKRGPVDRRGA